MLLTIDVGNTQTHIGAFEGDQLAEHWRIGTVRTATADELAVTLEGLLALRSLGLDDIHAAVASSVVPTLGPEWVALCDRHLSVACLLVGPGIRSGIPIQMDNPREVGADRLVNALAAYDRFGGACVVADFGTAITFDAVSGEGAYLGGTIAPGVEISLEALTERAAKLPNIDLVPPQNVIGKTTTASIQAGVIYGTAGAVDGIARRLRAELGPDTGFVATGGLAPSIIPYCETIDEIDEMLTLTGMRLLYERNG